MACVCFRPVADVIELGRNEHQYNSSWLEGVRTVKTGQALGRVNAVGVATGGTKAVRLGV